MNHARNISHTPLYTRPSSHNHTQSKQIIRESSNVQNITQPRPASRPGWGVSLRRASPSPRREHKLRCVGITGSRLSEIPPRLGELPACSKGERVAWARSRAGPPCFISPRRDWLAWARLTGLATVLHWNSHVFRPKHTCKAFLCIQKTDPIIHSTNNAQPIQKETQNHNPNFPYLEKAKSGCVSNSGTRSSNGRLKCCGTDAEEHTWAYDEPLLEVHRNGGRKAKPEV